MKASAVDFLTKPFRDQDMLDAVSTAIELDRERRAAQQAAGRLRKQLQRTYTRADRSDAICDEGTSQQADRRERWGLQTSR